MRSFGQEVAPTIFVVIPVLNEVQEISRTVVAARRGYSEQAVEIEESVSCSTA